MTMPAQKPNRSRQDFATPLDFLDAVRARFGAIAWDLAANASNCTANAPRNYYGPGSAAGEDSLVQDWSKLSGTLFLNPPFGDIATWAEKAHASWRAVQADPARRHRHDWRLLLLTPASVGANWFARNVHGAACVLAISPRLTFGSETQPYPKDLILSVYALRPTFDLWRWCGGQRA